MNIPSQLEQDKISKFLATLDKRIELQEKLVEKLEEEKKWHLQKLFPKKGIVFPNLDLMSLNALVSGTIQHCHNYLK